MYVTKCFYFVSIAFSCGLFDNKLISAKVIASDVTLYLYTRENVETPITLVDDTLEKVDVNKKTKIIIHGYFENFRKIWYKNMTEEYLKNGDHNVIQVDWSLPATDIYMISAYNAQFVGSIIGKVISKLHINFHMPLENVHVIGHSLGAHVSGYVGKEVLRSTGNAIARITALDAAGPFFDSPFALMVGLTAKDARVVDAIHTDGGVFGCINPIGTVDFFPNGGTALQPGCLVNLFYFPLQGYDKVSDAVFCSHQRSYYYFISSINEENFEAQKCNSWDNFNLNRCQEIFALMGDKYTYRPEATGTFFLKTNPNFPFAKQL